jgi:hypothetical protein
MACILCDEPAAYEALNCGKWDSATSSIVMDRLCESHYQERIGSSPAAPCENFIYAIRWRKLEAA